MLDSYKNVQEMEEELKEFFDSIELDESKFKDEDFTYLDEGTASVQASGQESTQ